MKSFDYIRPKKLNNSRILSWFTYKNPGYLREGAKIPGLNLGFNTQDDQGQILENIHFLSSDLDFTGKDLVLGHQVHGTNILNVSKGGFYENSDAFISNTPGTVLGIQVADCAAVLFGDFENSVIGAAHAGWRGAVAEIVPKTVDAMVGIGAEPSKMEVFVSPCLAQHNFEVGQEVANQFPAQLIDWENYNKPHIDLSGLISFQLSEKGIKSSHVEIDGRCTIDHEEHFYSYRREKDRSGRMLALIRLNKV